MTNMLVICLLVPLVMVISLPTEDDYIYLPVSLVVISPAIRDVKNKS